MCYVLDAIQRFTLLKELTHQADPHNKVGNFIRENTEGQSAFALRPLYASVARLAAQGLNPSFWSAAPIKRGGPKFLALPRFATIR